MAAVSDLPYAERPLIPWRIADEDVERIAKRVVELLVADYTTAERASVTLAIAADAHEVKS